MDRVSISWCGMDDSHMEYVKKNVKMVTVIELTKPNVMFCNKFPKDFAQMYEDLEPGGMCIFFEAADEKVQQAILAWRLENQHSPEIHVIKEDLTWFWIKPKYDRDIPVEAEIISNGDIIPAGGNDEKT